MSTSKENQINTIVSIETSKLHNNWFNKLEWQSDRMLFEGLVFRLEHYRDDKWELGDNCFVFYKTKELVDQYAKYWSLRPTFKANNIFELGMWDGGSVAFWFEYFQPRKHVGIDIYKREDSLYFSQYIQSRQLENRIKTYWNTNQTDAKRLRQIVLQEFSEPLDLVVDDASHMYDLTKKSFEILFPLLRPGGLYIIEDWAWGHWAEFQKPDHPWSTKIPLTQLIFQLVEAVGTNQTERGNALISNVTIFQGFAVVERGEYQIMDSNQFQLEHFISRQSTSQRAFTMQYVKDLIKRWAKFS